MDFNSDNIILDSPNNDSIINTFPNQNFNQRNTINEEDEELDQSYGTNKLKKTERIENINNNIENSNFDNNKDEDGEYYNIYQDDEPEEEEPEYIDFNNQNAYESDYSLGSRNSYEGEDNGIKTNSIQEVHKDIEIIASEIDNENITKHLPTTESQEADKLNNQIKSNIISKKNSIIKNGKQINIKKKKLKFNEEEKKLKKFYEDKRETKTIFSKISEEIIYKLTKDKYSKTSSYEYITNDMYINRVVQKGDQENKNRFQDFVERNNEFFNKKKLRLNEKIKKISDEANSKTYSIPNKKIFTKSDLRNPEQFYEDQNNFILQKMQKIFMERDEKSKNTDIESHGHIPEINKHSKEIAEKKIATEKTEVFVKLYNQRNNKNKKHLFDDYEKKNLSKKENQETNTENNINNANKSPLNLINGKKENQRNSLPLEKKGNEKNQITLKLKGVKKTNEELKFYSTKLHDDAKKLLKRKEERIRKLFAKESPDLQCKKTKLMNVHKFIENYENALEKLFKEKSISTDYNNDFNQNQNIIYNNEHLKTLNNMNDFKINFKDYCFLLKSLGFIKNDYETIKANIESDLEEELNLERKHLLEELNERLLNPNKKLELMKKKIKKEAKLVKDSWYVLFTNTQKENVINEYEILESKDVFIFLCVLQGYLKGNTNKISEEEQNEIEQIEVNNLFRKIEKTEKSILKEKSFLDNINKKKFHKNAKSQEKNLIMKGNLKVLENTIQKPIFKISKDNIFCNKLVLSDDEYNLNNINDAKLNTDYNKFKRIKSGESVNKFLRISSENVDNLDENCENKYKRKKSKINDMNINEKSNNNEEEYNISTRKYYKDQFDTNLENINLEDKEYSNNKENYQIINKIQKEQPILEDQGHKSFKKTDEINDIDIISKFFKFIDMKNYPYSRSVAKKIKIIFRLFIENITEFSLNNKVLLNNKEDKIEIEKPCADLNNQNNKFNINQNNENLKNKFYYNRYKHRVLSHIENEMALKQEYNTINTSENMSNRFNTHSNIISARRTKLKMKDAYEYQRKRKERELAKLRELKEEIEMKQCTFQPNIDQLHKTPKTFNLKALVDKLYKDGLAKIQEKREFLKKHEEEMREKEMDPNIVTFRPTIHSVNESVFLNKNIEAYEVSKKNVERLERARIEKKIAELQKKSGITNLNQINNIDYLLTDDNYPAWIFTLEKKVFKDTFDDTSRFRKMALTKSEFTPKTNPNNTLSYMLNSINNTKINHINTDNAFYLDVNLNEETPVVKLRIRLNDNPIVVAEEFAKTYELSEEKKNKLTTLIEERLNKFKVLRTQGSK